MVNKDIISYFTRNLNYWFNKVDKYDCCTLKHHKENHNELIPEYRESFGIPLNEDILFTRDSSFWSSHDQGLVITDRAIYCLVDNEKPNEVFDITWTTIDHVVYKEFCFYFFDEDNEQISAIHSDYFFKNVEASELEQSLGRKLANHLTEMAKIAGEEVDPYHEFFELYEADKYDEALNKLEEQRADNKIDDDAYYHYWKGRTLLLIETTLEDCDENRFNTIDKELCKAIELDDEERKLTLLSQYWRAQNYQLYGQSYNARNLYLLCMESESENIREASKENLEQLEEESLAEIWEKYVTTYDYKDRKFIMPINDYEIAGCFVNGIDTFRMSNIPSCIKFPTGHPIANELYIGHPYNPALYVPYSQSEDIFFLDKIHELSYLLECLGAEEITITSIKGRNVSAYTNYDGTLNVNADVELFESQGGGSKKGQIESSLESSSNRTIRWTFDPMQKPFVPEDLVWYSEQPQWQRLANSRLNGNMLDFNEFVSTSETKFVSESEQTNIKASAGYLWAKVSGDAEMKLESQFKEKIETQWKVEVKFRSVKDIVLVDNSTNSSKVAITSQYTKAEQEYLDNLKEFLEEDAEITPRERKMLDRIRQNLGIREERAQELEDSLQPQLTEDEQEYLEMYREYAEKGEITEKERRRLDKFANALGLSKDRLKEIETL